MRHPRRSCLSFLALLPALLLAAACADQAALRGENRDYVDFSGTWEMDYGLSDNLQSKLQRVYLDMRRDIERRQNGNRMDPWGGQGPVVTMGGGSGGEVSRLVDLARLADYINRATTLEIEQSEFDITVEREEDFALTCDFSAGESQHFVGEDHAEICGWDGHQLVFQVQLPGGLSVTHRLTMAADGSKLNLATTVRAGNSPYPFTLNRVYQRFEALPSGYDCEFTLTRGTVCGQDAS